ncbi:hypothetical protein GCM10011351_17970 [Paraliobacillus quinghaiensis]|uniref:Peptidase M14 domain-containing protein n=1 Tax=Paraliobacillus quinghaiensis TaxID=470815 RepID=A0A917TS18_9BACI|nr:M14 family metallocarboxypeptidase [Paraliobacillus quinghaiensis]GGM32308.1 hypothetical protein GCM10011351_17970 [Paraliobacillus quinghaiensis]
MKKQLRKILITLGVLCSFFSFLSISYANDIEQGGNIDELEYKFDAGEAETKEYSAYATNMSEEYSNYFQVTVEEATVYDIRSNPYKRVGELVKSQEYERVGESGNYHKIKYGDYYGYVHKTNTRVSKGTTIENKRKNEKNSTIVIKAKKQVTVYDNSSGSFIPFGTISKDTRYTVISGSENWWKISLGGRIGYIHKSAVLAEFTKDDRYFQVTVENAVVYDIRSNPYERVGVLVKGQEYERVGESGSYHKIKYGDYYGYVHKTNTHVSKGTTIKNKRENEKNSNRVIKTKKELAIYDNSSGSFIPFGTIPKDTKYTVITGSKNWWKVVLAGRIGYIHKSATSAEFRKDDRYFQVTENAVVYDIRSNPYERVGLLVKDQEYERVGESGNYHKIKFGTYYGYVHKTNTIPITNSNFGNTSRKDFIIGTLITKDKVSVYDNTGVGSYKVFALIEEGKEIPVVGQTENWVEVNISGRYGLIHKSVISTEMLTPKNLVNPNQEYSYKDMERDISELEANYQGLITTTSIGKSVNGRNLYTVKLGRGDTEIFLNGAHHAREWLTTNLLMEMIDTYSQAYINNSQIDGYDVRDLLNKVSIWFVPMVNPDGVTLVQEGAYSTNNPQKVIEINNGSTDFSRWKANVRGVDLNRQYPAGWETIKYNRTEPSYMNHKGDAPLTEPETKAIYDFTLDHDFKTAVAYHSSGEILFWDYKLKDGSESKATSRNLADMISDKTGYSLVMPGPNQSGGGFTDWFMHSQNKPAFTPEISPPVGERPVPLSNFSSIWNQNHSIGLMLAEEAYRNRNNR